MKLNINGIDKEVSKETCALAVTDYFAKHPEPKPEPPKLRHGDYGTTEVDSWIHFKGKTYWSHEECTGSACSDSHFLQHRLGNIFDDLARNKVDLEEFEVELEYDEKLKFETRLCHTNPYICLIQTMTSGKQIHAHIDIKQAPEIHQKLGQMIATAHRRQKKD